MWSFLSLPDLINNFDRKTVDTDQPSALAESSCESMECETTSPFHLGKRTPHVGHARRQNICDDRIRPAVSDYVLHICNYNRLLKLQAMMAEIPFTNVLKEILDDDEINSLTESNNSLEGRQHVSTSALHLIESAVDAFSVCDELGEKTKFMTEAKRHLKELYELHATGSSILSTASL